MSGLPRSAHALVTGGGRGIGRAIASALVQSGATVTVLGRDRATLDRGHRGRRRAFRGSRRRGRSGRVGAAIAEAAARQPIDILIANAGAAESAPFAKSDAALFRRMMDVNFMGVVHAVQAALPSMKDAPLRPHRRGGVDRRSQGLCLCQRLQRRQTCGGWIGALAGAGTREHQRHRQRGLSRFHRDRSAKPAASTTS